MASPSTLVTPHVAKIMALIDAHCVDKVGSAIKALEAEQPMGAKFLNFDPNDREPWKGLLAANSVDPKSIRMPVFIAQGLDDQIVITKVTERFAAALSRKAIPWFST